MSGREPEATRPTNTQTRAVQLVEAKDRAQSTATIAMSVVHVAYLRTIVVAGPDSNRFYTPVLWLVIISLVLQVAAGLLALAISQMKSYYQTHRDSMCADIRERCCFFCCPPRQAFDAYEEELSSTDNEGCFTKCVGHSPISEYEKSVYQCSATIRKEIVTMEQAAIEAEINIAPTSDIIAVCRSKLEALRKEKDKMKDTVHIEKLNNLTEEETAAEARLARYSRTIRKLEMAVKKRAKLEERVDEMVEEDFLKRVAFWQSCLNYVFYVIAVTNIFVSGLGVGGAVVENGGGVGTRDIANNATVVSDAK